MTPILGSGPGPYATSQTAMKPFADTVSLIDARRRIYDPCYDASLLERRQSERICSFVPAVVRGVSAGGTKFRAQATLDNFSSTGLFLHLSQPVSVADKIFVVFQLRANKECRASAPWVAVQGVVHRTKGDSDIAGGESVGVAVRIRKFRFL